jgi:hypothetical protein
MGYLYGVDAHDLLRALLDPDRLAVVGAIARTSRTSRRIADLTGVEERTVVRTLAPLVQQGLVTRERDPASGDAYIVQADAWRSVASRLPQAPPVAARIGFGMTDGERDVLARFFVGEHLPQLPAQRAKRLVVLERLALEFEPGERYPETEVNARLGRFNDDHSTLRRALVDEGLLDREPGPDRDGRSSVLYWRVGGRLV